MKAEKLTLINGNKQPYEIALPLVVIQGYLNDVAISHIEENTGLKFVPHYLGYQAQPETSGQVVALFLTYNFKTRYFNNWNHTNTLILKSDHHIGFQVDSICFNCCKENSIPTMNLKPNERLSC